MRLNKSLINKKVATLFQYRDPYYPKESTVPVHFILRNYHLGRFNTYLLVTYVTTTT
jgi:hypothetical protein